MSKTDDPRQDTRLLLTRAYGLIGQGNVEIARLTKELADTKLAVERLKAQLTECEESVIQKIRQRRDAGRQKYGMPMERTDLTKRDWMRHAQEEALDLAIYLEKLIQAEQI